MPLIPVFPGDLSYSASDCVIPRTTVTLVVDGEDLSEYYAGYDLGGTRGQQVGGSIKLADRDGTLGKRISQFSQDHDEWRGHDRTDDRTISLTVAQGSSTTQYPTLLPGTPSWDNDGLLSWGVTDMTPLLNKDNQSMTDVIWDERGPEDDKMASEIIQALATMGGVVITPTAADWAVRTFRMTQANLLSKIDEMCRPTQSYRKWVDDELILEKLNEALAASHTIVDRKHIASLTASKDDSGLRTYFKAFRLRSQPQALAEPVQGDTVGRVVEISFPPSEYVRIRTKCKHGTIGEGVFYDEDENELNTFDVPQTEFYGTPTVRAVRWVGTYTPVFGDVEYQPWWWVSATGGLYNSLDLMIEGFEFEQAVAAAETLFGRREEYSNLATELIREPETFIAMMTAVVAEVLWSVRQFNLTTPWLFNVREGGFVNVTHYKHKLSAEKMLVQGWRHSHSWDAGWNNTYDLRAKLL